MDQAYLNVVLIGGSGFPWPRLTCSSGPERPPSERGRPGSIGESQLISSREGTVRLVGEVVRQLDNPPAAWVQLSSLAVFGDSGDTIIDESTPVPVTGIRQQVEVCLRWEAAYEQATSGLARTVLLRPGGGWRSQYRTARRRAADHIRFNAHPHRASVPCVTIRPNGQA